MKGLKRHRQRLKNLANVNVQSGLVRAASNIRDDAKASIIDGFGVPSAAGQSPHNQTGALRAGIVSGPLGTNGAHVTSTDSASASIEFGRSDAAARPFLRPAVQRNLKEISRTVGQEVRINLRRT
ncbi:hypothetical protein [Devosia ginsengisoli]|uniref:hypothetical protein n=1 Tax=Devosia ginsengisoli TaxID=400770 RepID=UPI0026EC5515|nr:hypothetical protein [Devosia ginsengisoli]MCR6670028.1 hypothetical protein [Devosia ginsengisoli]